MADSKKGISAEAIENFRDASERRLNELLSNIPEDRTTRMDRGEILDLLHMICHLDEIEKGAGKDDLAALRRLATQV